MRSVTIADARAHLIDLVDRAAAGEPVCITRGGKPLAQITGIGVPRKAIDLAALQAFTDSLPEDPDTAAVLTRRMREDGRS